MRCQPPHPLQAKVDGGDYQDILCGEVLLDELFGVEVEAVPLKVDLVDETHFEVG
jgi:hypothetical protein